MPIDIVSIDFLDSDFSTITTGVDYLNGSIGDKLTAEIVIDVHWETPIDTPMTVSTTGIDSIDRYDGGSFISDGFKNGDSILVSIGANVLVPVTVLGTFPTKLNVSAGLSAELVPVGGIVYGVTPIQNLDFYYGIVANNVPSSTISLIDGSVQKFKSGTIIHTNTTPSSILPDTTVNSWVYDLTDQNSTIEGLGALVDINHQQFKIVHEFYIEPVFRTQDLATGGNLVTPSFLANVQSLKYTFKVDGRYATTGGVIDKSTSNGNIIQFIKTGDVGYFDETGNGAVADYTLDSISYLETLNNTPVTAIQPNAETNVSISLDSANGSFSNTGTEFIVQVYRTPNDANTYENTTTDIKENFLVSRQSLTINDVPTVSGEGFIKAGATAAMVNFNKAIINFTFLPTFFTSQDNVVADLQAFNNDPANTADGYLIFVTCQDKTITNKGNSDKVAVLCDVNTAAGLELEDFYNTDGVCVTTTKFNDHPKNDPSLAFTDYKGWLEDSVVTKTNIQVLKTNNNQDINGNVIQNVWNLNNVTLKIEAEHKIDSTRFFTLEESKVFIAGVDETITRTFILPTGDAQNEIIWVEGLETATHKQYDLQYPFKIRWEDWKVLYGADNDFVNPSQDWIEYITSEWDIKVNIYKEIDVVQEPETAASPCGLIQFTDSNINEYNGNAGNWSYIIETTGQLPTTTILETGFAITQELFVPIQAANKPALNTPMTVCIDAENATDIFRLEFDGYQGLDISSNPIGDLDLSALTSMTKFGINRNNLTSLILPQTTSTTTEWKFQNIGIDLDLSVNTNLGGILYISNSLMSNLTLPASTEVFSSITIVLCPNLTGVDFTPLTGNSSDAAITLFSNNFSAAVVDQILIDLDATGWTATSGFINIQNNSAPTVLGLTAKTNLQGKGWVVITD